MGKKFKPGKPPVDPFVNRAFAKQFTQSTVDSVMREAQRNMGIPNAFFRNPVTRARQVVQDDMWWQTQDGRRMRASEMETRHLYNSLRLLHDKMVPEQYRIAIRDANFQSQVSVENDQWRFAIKVLLTIITKRLVEPAHDKEFTDTMLEDLDKMTKNIKTLL